METWTWLHLNNKNQTQSEEIITSLNLNNFTGILVEGDPERVAAFAKRAVNKGIKVQYWFWTLINTEPELRDTHPEWFNISRSGKSSLTHPPYVEYYKWLCPSKLEVQDHILERIKSLCEIDAISGIHLDYVRYPDVILPEAIQPNYGLKQPSETPQFDFCYCETCREQYKKISGIDPLQLEDPSQDPAWLDYRYDSVTNLVTRISSQVHASGKKLSAAVFPHPETALKLVRQDWTKWDLDAIYPMMYYNFYYKTSSWITKIFKDLKEIYSYSIPVIPGIYIPDMNELQFQQTLEIIRNTSAAGTAFFDYNSLVRKKFLNCK